MKVFVLTYNTPVGESDVVGTFKTSAKAQERMLKEVKAYIKSGNEVNNTYEYVKYTKRNKVTILVVEWYEGCTGARVHPLLPSIDYCEENYCIRYEITQTEAKS